MKNKMFKNKYGKELILDMHECDPSTFTRKSILGFFKKLCKEIDMHREKVIFWDELYVLKAKRYTEDHLIGTSAVQFITTSNITIHTLDILKCVYLNIFSCKNFNPKVAKKIASDWFKGKVINNTIIDRK